LAEEGRGNMINKRGLSFARGLTESLPAEQEALVRWSAASAKPEGLDSFVPSREHTCGIIKALEGELSMGVRVRCIDGAWYVFVNHQRRRQARKVGPTKGDEKAVHELAEQWRAQLALGQLNRDTDENIGSHTPCATRARACC
jgi:hypothetical protein